MRLLVVCSPPLITYQVDLSGKIVKSKFIRHEIERFPRNNGSLKWTH